MEKTVANNFLVRFWNFAKNKNFRLIGDKTAASRNDPEWRHGKVENVVSGLFQTYSWRPEDWIVLL